MIQFLDYLFNHFVTQVVIGLLTAGTIIIAYLNFFWKVNNYAQFKALISKRSNKKKPIKIRFTYKRLKSVVLSLLLVLTSFLLVWGVYAGYKSISRFLAKKNTVVIGVLEPPYGEMSSKFIQGINLAVKEYNDNFSYNRSRLEVSLFKNPAKGRVDEFALMMYIESNPDLIGIINALDSRSASLIENLPSTLQIVPFIPYPYMEDYISNSVWLRAENDKAITSLLAISKRISKNPLIIDMNSNRRIAAIAAEVLNKYSLVQSNGPNELIYYITQHSRSVDGVIFLSIYPAYFETISEIIVNQGIELPLFFYFPNSISYKEIYFLNNEIYCTGLYEYSYDMQKNEKQTNFIWAFKNEYYLKPDYFSAVGYDAAKVLINGFNESKIKDPKSIRKCIIEKPAYQGASGVIRFNSKGVIQRQDSTVYKIKNRKISIYNP